MAGKRCVLSLDYLVKCGRLFGRVLSEAGGGNCVGDVGELDIRWVFGGEVADTGVGGSGNKSFSSEEVKDFISKLGGDIELAENKLRRDGGLVLLEGLGDFSYDVNGGCVVGEKILLSFLGGGNLCGVEGFQVLGGKGQLETEEDDEPGYENPQDAEGDKADDAIDVAVRYELGNVLSKAPFCERPDKGADGCAPYSCFGIDFCIGQDEVKKEKRYGGYYVGENGRTDV